MLVRTESRHRKIGFGSGLGYELRIFLWALLAGLPGIVSALVLLWGPYGTTLPNPWVITGGVVAVWIVLASALRRRIVFPLKTISNLIAALREGDFSVRGREGRALVPADTLEELTREVNALAQTLHQQRLGAVEATALFRKVMEEIDVAVFAFDAEHISETGQPGGRTAAQLLPSERAVGETAETLGLARLPPGDAPRLFDASFPAATGRWEIRRSVFRQEGLPHQLLVLSDLTRTLREEELQAWQRIVRVIGHEINNSPGADQVDFGQPAKPACPTRPSRRLGGRSEQGAGHHRFAFRIAEPLHDCVRASGQPSAAKASACRRRRTGSPRCQPGNRFAVAVEPDAPATTRADADQIEQVLINLIAMRSTRRWKPMAACQHNLEAARTAHLEVQVADEGPGLSNTSNLFVPFFTTKPGGSGIGLVLSVRSRRRTAARFVWKTGHRAEDVRRICDCPFDNSERARIVG